MSQAEDPLVNCPLDVVHRIRKSRMQTHLVKCLKNHNLGRLSKLKCPFNPLHIVEAVEITHHCLSCPDSESVLMERYEIEGEKCFSGILSIDEHQKQYNEMVKNNAWDEEYIANKTAYDPTADIENKPVLRSLNCESKSKRRAFRNQERKRFATIENNEIFDRKSAREASTEVQDKPLRQPYSLPAHGTTVAAEPQPAKSIVTNKQTSLDIEKTVSELIKDNTEENQSCEKNNSKHTADDSKKIINLQNEEDIESVTDVLERLRMLEKVESDVKEQKRKLINMMSLANAVTTAKNPISYRDVAISKSTVVSSNIIDSKSSLTRAKSKCAANFNINNGPSGASGASSSTLI